MNEVTSPAANDEINVTDIDFAASDLLGHTTTIVTAMIGRGLIVNSSEVPTNIATIYSSLSTAAGLDAQPVEPEPTKQDPAVPVRSSVKPDYIVCLEDGKKLKMLKRHLMTVYGMTPDQYREKWNLPADYPMTAPNYAEQRRALAVKSGLGRKGGTEAAASTETDVADQVQPAPQPEQANQADDAPAPTPAPLDEQTTESIQDQQPQG